MSREFQVFSLKLTIKKPLINEKILLDNYSVMEYNILVILKAHRGVAQFGSVLLERS